MKGSFLKETWGQLLQCPRVEECGILSSARGANGAWLPHTGYARWRGEVRRVPLK